MTCISLSQQAAKALTSGKLALAAITLAAASASAEGWPMFRGPHGNGRIDNARLPLSWSETNNVLWKTAIPHLGWSTPVVAGSRIWLTSATEDGKDFFAFCVDAETGRILIEKQLFHCDNPEPLGNSVNCYASPSPAIEKDRVYVHFGSYGTACLDVITGETIWRRDDLKCRHFRGPGSSVILHRDLLILTFDGADLQYLAALNKHTGATVWQSKREVDWKDLDAAGQPINEGDFRKGFTTPLVISHNGGQQLISPASSTIFAYDPDTGKELWRITNQAHTPSVSPVFADGLVLAATGVRKPEMLAIRPEGRGDITDTHVAWRITGKDVPHTPSPAVLDGLMYMVSDHGALTCVEIATGGVIWREKLGGSQIASPVHDGQRVYFFGASGKTIVIRAGRKYEQLADSRLDAGFMASPSVFADSFILRTKTHLYRIADKPE